MELFLLLVVLGVLAYIGIAITKSSRSSKATHPSAPPQPAEETPSPLTPHELEPFSLDTLPYRKTNSLLTKTEHAFYSSLRAATPNHLAISPKVRLGDLLWIPNYTKGKQGYLNRVNSKHVDFVLCDPETLAPRLVIELDDPSHDAPERQERDLFVDAALATAGLPILRVRTQRVYDEGELARQIASSLGAVKMRVSI